ncbi:MAG: IS110 family transposase [Paracoccaceae bacterium]
MDYVGIDVHKRESQICILTDEGELIERRIPTERSRLATLLGDRARARILIEASTESEWVARRLEAFGHEVVVADPNYTPMYANRSRRVKTDRRDARTLADACRLGAYRPAHRTSDAQRQVRAQLAVRDALVRTRVRSIALVGALLRRDGMRVRSGNADGFVARVQVLQLPAPLRSTVAPLLALLETLNQHIRAADHGIAEIVHQDPTVRRLCTLPGVGPVTATAFVATLDEIGRFAGAHQVESYLGLVPREKSSGEKQHKGRITKAGNSRARWLLVEAAWSVLRSKRPSTEELRTWALRIALRRGTRIAVVALARRLAGILYAMWRDRADYQPRALSSDKRPAAA